MSVPNKHESCNMQVIESDCGPQFIGEAINLDMDEVAIATSNTDRISVSRNASRVEIQDIKDKIAIHLFLPESKKRKVPEVVVDSADSVTYCVSISKRLIADREKVYIRKGTFNRSRTEIIETAKDHRCSYDEPTPSEFMSEFLDTV